MTNFDHLKILGSLRTMSHTPNRAARWCWCLLLLLCLCWVVPGVQAQLLEKKLTASDLDRLRAFGKAVAIDGDFAIVGDPEEEAAYLFGRNQGGPDNWGEVKKLVPSYQGGGGGFSDDFGASVAISGDLAIVGAPYTDHSGLFAAGAAYLFARNQGGPDNWGEVKMLTASNASDADHYGTAVALQGDAAFVSAPFEYRVSGPGYGIDGFVYVYRQHRNGPNQWGQVSKVAPVAPTAAVRFGWSLDVSGELLLVGAPHVCSPCPQVPGEAFVFARNQNGPDQWGQVRKILPNNSAADDEFGYAVALNGHYALISAQPSGQDGRAYIFERHRGGLDQWGQVRQLAVNDPGNISGRFGYALALEGGQALVGDPDATVNGVVSQGAVYRFDRNQGGPNLWGQIEKRTPSNLQASHGYFGVAVDASGDMFMIGDPSADHGDVSNCGAAFIYWPDPCAEDERPPEIAEVRVEDEKTYYRITLSLTDETGIAALDLTKVTNAQLVALDPKPGIIKEGPEGEVYYSYFDTSLRINAVLEKVNLRDDIDFTLIVRDPCNPPFVLNWERFWENPSKQAATAPPAVHLAPAYPNPFNPEARFTLTLDEEQPITVTIYDVLGRVVARLHEGPLAAGQHTFRFGDATWASGLYLYEVVGANLRETRTITLLR